ncbi:hypothetical protein GF420_08180 [candidate division GN15 bacterium]|nr:hypothetical protein [candidate division GN15 bacterium]
MKTNKLLTMFSAAILVAGASLIGCSAEEPEQKPTPMQKLTHTISETVAESVIQAVKARSDTTVPTDAVDTLSPAAETSTEAFAVVDKTSGYPVSDMVVIGSNLYALTADGLVVFDFVERAQKLVPTDTRLSAIASHAGKLYVGGDGLFVVEDSTLSPVDIDIPGEITSLEGYSYRLLIGTDNGLYSRSIFGDEVLLEDLPISALVSTGDDVWVGTAGDGLFQFDGVDFKERYLSRDPSLMDRVTALDYKYNHLYVGTPAGLFIYDGGRWDQLTAENGLPSGDITAIDASYWVVVIGTDAGATSYFDGDLMPLDKLNNVEVTSTARYNKKIIVGTANGDLVVKSGPVVRSLINRPSDSSVDLFSALK